MSQHDEAGKQFGAWARKRAGVATAEPTKPNLTPDEAKANAASGGADGGAGRDDQQERPRDPSDVIREAAALRRLRHRL